MPENLTNKELVDLHNETFGKAPNIIGLLWSKPEVLGKQLRKSIDDGVPYDEMNELTDEEREQFERGEILF